MPAAITAAALPFTPLPDPAMAAMVAGPNSIDPNRGKVVPLLDRLCCRGRCVGKPAGIPLPPADPGDEPSNIPLLSNVKLPARL